MIEYQDSNKNRQMQAEELLSTLLKMLQTICCNAGYPKSLQYANVLIDYQIYFDICRIIFKELSIKILKIQFYDSLTSAQKLQKLIDLLSLELSINLSFISAKQIQSFNVQHIYFLLSLLLEYSQIYMKSKQLKDKVKTDPDQNQKPNILGGHSAREKRSVFNQDDKRNLLKNQNQSPENQITPKGPGGNRHQKIKKGSKKMGNNICKSVVAIILGEKQQTLKASHRQNRSHKNKDLLEAKQKYKSYLCNYTKDNRSRKLRQKMAHQTRQTKNHLPMSDFKRIDNFFQSFAYKFRDQKAVYLRRIQRLVKEQEKDRYCSRARLERETRAKMQNLLKKNMQSLNHSHVVKLGLLQEQGKGILQAIALMKKQQARKSRQQQREFKEIKRKKLKLQENSIQQQNERILMQLEEGGKLQKTILSIYKKM